MLNQFKMLTTSTLILPLYRMYIDVVQNFILSKCLGHNVRMPPYFSIFAIQLFYVILVLVLRCKRDSNVKEMILRLEDLPNFHKFISLKNVRELVQLAVNVYSEKYH